MTKPLRLGIAVVVVKICHVFSAPVVRQFQNAALAEGPGSALANVLGRVLTRDAVVQKIQRELQFRKIELAQHAHAHDTGVKIERNLRIFDAQHGVVEDKTAGRIGGGGNARTRVDFGSEGHVKCSFKIKLTLEAGQANGLTPSCPR